jgi:NAD(P)-dependent dehydrogenase (short-subunit alcohol dehydrogenase family)
MRNWLITGVSGGIGLALAQAALEAGDAVAGAVRREEDAQAFEALAPGRAHALMLDVDRRPDIMPAVVDAIAALGHLDILVNNAGCSLFGAIEEVELAEAEAVFATNVFGPMAVVQAALPHMRARRKGVIVNISSGCGVNAVPGIGVYSASKFALEGLSEALAMEVQPFGLKVMIVEPGAINTRFISHGTRNSSRRLDAYAPLSGAGKEVLNAYYEVGGEPPETVAKAILGALASPEPPLRLMLGRDNRAMIRNKFETLLALASK